MDKKELEALKEKLEEERFELGRIQGELEELRSRERAYRISIAAMEEKIEDAELDECPDCGAIECNANH